MNIQASPAFDDCGEIVDVQIFTSGWFRENLGVGLTVPLAAIFCCANNRVKKMELANIMDAARLIATHAPISFNVIAADTESAYAESLREVFDYAATLPFPLPQEVSNATHVG